MTVLALDPVKSEAQRKAMWAAVSGHSTLGIPKSVGEKFVGKGHDGMADADWAELRDLLTKWLDEEADEPEHASDDPLMTSPTAGAPFLARRALRKALDMRAVGATDAVAFDWSENRSLDDDGHLRVASSIVSAAQVNDYLGREIPGFEALGLDPDRMYALLRDPVELEKAVPTLRGKPLVIVHRAQTADDHDREIVVGTVLNPTWDAPNVKAELIVWDQEGIDFINSGEQKDLSAGYRYTPVMESGELNGTKYEIRMRDIKFNHIALVKQGRVIGAMVGDSASEVLWEQIEAAILSVASG